MTRRAAPHHEQHQGVTDTMSVLNLTERLWAFMTASPAPRRAPRTARPTLTALEERCTPATGSTNISGVAFVDMNNNGVKEASERTLSGVYVTISGSTRAGAITPVRVLTNADGRFNFVNAAIGTYALYGASQPGYLATGSVTSRSGTIRINAVPQTVEGVTTFRNIPTRIVNLAFKAGQPPAGVSLQQLLASGGAQFISAPAGTGGAKVAFRENNLPTASTTALGNLTRARSAITPTANTQLIDLSDKFSDGDVTNSRIVVRTTEGDVNVDLFDKDAPKTVANFFEYVYANGYDNTLVHRNSTIGGGGGAITQGGGYRFNSDRSITATDKFAPIELEASFARLNSKGTLAMARTSVQNSATSEFFFNVGDNSTALGTSNGGGYAVFGKIVDAKKDQAIIDKLGGIDTRNVRSPQLAGPPARAQQDFTEMPLKNQPSGTGQVLSTATTSAQYARILEVKVVRRNEAFGYTATSSNSGVATVSVVNNRLKITYGATNGTTNVTVTCRDRFGATVTRTFTITVTA